MAYFVKTGNWSEKEKGNNNELNLDQLITTLSPGGSYTFSQGLTNTAGTVKLGGLITERVDIINSSDIGLILDPSFVYIGDATGNTASFAVNNTGELAGSGDTIGLSSNLSTVIDTSGTLTLGSNSGGNTILMDNLKIQIEVDGDIIIGTVPSVGNDIEITTGDKFIISSSGVNFPGAEYSIDFSADYTNRSLTDKEYVDTAVSDRRLKTNITYIDSALDKINLLKPATFNMIKDNEYKAGFIAQELQDIFPEMVVEGEFLKIKKDQLLPYLVKAIQELSKEINLIKSLI